ncbi:unnamed protein product [Effrenium voratum]|nr:unnamed protein product [Effrenium voratum]
MATTLMNSTLTCILALFALWLPLGRSARIAADLNASSVVKLVDRQKQYPQLCDKRIVQETCLLLNHDDKHEQGDRWINSDVLLNVLSTYQDSVTLFWDELNLPKTWPIDNETDGSSFWIECSTLCESVVRYSREYGVCPETSDVACYSVGEEVYCDLDVSPQTLGALGPKNRDMPNYEDRPYIEEEAEPEGIAARRSDMPLELEYELWEMVERVANLFRVYPAQNPEDLVDEDDGITMKKSTDDTGMTGQQMKQNKQMQELSKAYVAITIRAFSAKRTQGQMSRWFGGRAYSDSRSREEVLRVLNSVNHMISNVEYVYPGPECSPNTFAYVYPKARECDKSKLKSKACTLYKGKFVFYLCSLYFKRPREMVETLVHEGSHHSTAFTDDVTFNGAKAYGRRTCQELAGANPGKALKNADNFCYYIQDAATEVKDVTEEPPPAAPRCPDFAEFATADSDGDCQCKPKSKCYSVKAGHTGLTEQCEFSKTSSRGTRSSEYFLLGCPTCRCLTPRPPVEEPAKPKCPIFASRSTPNSDGDCFCPSSRVCMFAGAGGSQVGCPYSRTPHYGTSSSNAFSATCARCSCQDSSYADGAGYVEASDSSCPDFAAQRKPDNLGHCYCRMAEVCIRRGKVGCPTAPGYAQSDHYFVPSCKDCKCGAKSTVSRPAHHTHSSSCPAGTTAMSDGYCRCRTGTYCYEGPTYTCPTRGVSRTGAVTRHSMKFLPSCRNCHCRSR